MSKTNVVIIGGGIVGVCTAYYLSKEDNVDVTIVENAEIAGAASGKAGGFLAKDWHASATESLGYLSYDLHKRLAEELDGRTRWHYRALQTSNVVLKATQATGNSKPKANVVHDGEEVCA